jgi:diacylglycerol kinase
MWWFIIYVVIGYAFYTFSYFYLSNEYEFPIHEDNFRKHFMIIAVSVVIGLLWPITLVKCVIYTVNKYKNE